MSERTVFLDRDGVLNHDRATSVRSVAELEVLDGAPEAVARLTRAGYRLIVVTNQSIIGRGLVEATTVEAIHEALARRIHEAGGTITGIELCPHAPEDGCDCRKPRPGLLLRAAARYGVDLSSTWFVGDKQTDVAAARSAGCRPALVRSGAPLDEPVDGVPVFDDLAAFADYLLGAGDEVSSTTTGGTRARR